MNNVKQNQMSTRQRKPLVQSLRMPCFAWSRNTGPLDKNAKLPLWIYTRQEAAKSQEVISTSGKYSWLISFNKEDYSLIFTEKSET